MRHLHLHCQEVHFPLILTKIAFISLHDSRDISVGRVTNLRARRPEEHGSILSTGKNPDRVSCRPSLLKKWKRKSFPVDKAAET